MSRYRDVEVAHDVGVVMMMMVVVGLMMMVVVVDGGVGISDE